MENLDPEFIKTTKAQLLEWGEIHSLVCQCANCLCMIRDNCKVKCPYDCQSYWCRDERIWQKMLEINRSKLIF